MLRFPKYFRLGFAAKHNSTRCHPPRNASNPSGIPINVQGEPHCCSDVSIVGADESMVYEPLVPNRQPGPQLRAVLDRIKYLEDYAWVCHIRPRGPLLEEAAPLRGTTFFITEHECRVVGVPHTSCSFLPIRGDLGDGEVWQLGDTAFELPEHSSALVEHFLSLGSTFVGTAKAAELSAYADANSTLGEALYLHDKGVSPSELKERLLQGMLNPTRNPHNHHMSTGGSSGACAALVAAGCASFALGSDGGGSARVPAAMNGVFGWKASRMPPFRPIDGIFVRSPEDLKLVLEAGGVAVPTPSSTRIGLTFLGIEIEAPIREATENVAQRLNLVEIARPRKMPTPGEMTEAFMCWWSTAIHSNVKAKLNRARDTDFDRMTLVTPALKTLFAMGAKFQADVDGSAGCTGQNPCHRRVGRRTRRVRRNNDAGYPVCGLGRR
eukprot:TRINITY_DN3708_c0_g2_i1.p1 TRINITY_DN3708_c0_g2~~TRINITY_DN3708_c0_g2_i1.p1  ORF type:complete len:446 (+),score=26.89 TRINITY_DN3708_c0_g2_i1:27-1340(+)